MENGYRYNLEFFKEIKRFWNNRDSLGWNSVVNLAGNILAFMPFGFFVPILFRIGRNIISCVLLSGIFSFIIETVQLMTQVGAFDVDDILLNAIGGLVGFFCYIVFWKPHQRKKVK